VLGRVLALAILIFAAVISACSQGKNAVSIPNYQTPNLNCENMDLSSAKLDAPTLRAFTHCLNSNHALDPMDQMLSELSDKDLEPIADAISDYILTQAPTLYQLDQSYQHLISSDKVDATFANIASLLDHDDFIAQSITLLKDLAYQQSSFPMSLFKSPTVDPQILAALQYLAPKVTAGNVGTGIDVGMTIAVAPAFQSLQAKFRPSGSHGRSLETLTDLFLAYVQDQSGTPVEVGKRALQEIVPGDLFRAVDETIGGSSPAHLQTGTDRMASVMKVSFESGGQLFDGLSSLFSTLHVPIQCLRDTQTVPDGILFAMGEIARQNSSDVANYLESTHPLTILSVRPLCNYPDALVTYFPYLTQLADTSAMEPAADLLKALYRPVLAASDSAPAVHPLANLFVDAVSESAIKKLIPVFSELNDRDTWDDILLLATLPKEEDRADIGNAVQYLLNPIPGLSGNQSVYDVFHSALSRISPLDFYRFISSLKSFVDSDTPIAKPALQSIRDFFYTDDVHPLTNALQKILQDAPSHSALLDSFFKLSQTKNFKASLRLTSTLARDGRLKELLNTIFTIYKKFSQTGQTLVHHTVQPAFVAKSRHALSELDLKPFALVIHPMNPSDPCGHLDIGFDFSKIASSNYTSEVDTAIGCLSESLGDPTVNSTIQYLESQQTESGMNYFQFPISMLEKWAPSQADLQYLSDTYLRNFDTGYIFNLMDVVPFFITRNIAPGPQAQAGQVLRPLFDLAKPLIAQRQGLDYLESFAANELRRDDFPQSLSFGDRLLNQKLDPVDAPVVAQFDRERIARWVGNRECETNVPGAMGPSGQPDREIRTSQIIDDFNNAIDDWSLQNGQPKRTLDMATMRSEFANTFKKLSDPSLNDPSESLIQALERVLQDFTLQPGQAPNANQHFTPDDLIHWLKDRSSDYRLIRFFYKDENGNFEEKPRVKLVNSLDRLEQVLVSANFDFSLLGLTIIGNSSLKYMGELAEAWGDEPRELWPDQIKAIYPPGSQIKKIQDVVSEMFDAEATYSNVAGFPSLPDCEQVANPNDPPEVQEFETNWPSNATGLHIPEFGFFRSAERNIFNLNQVLSVMQENVPLDRSHPNSKIDPAHQGGMKILRDIVFQLRFSTLPEYRSDRLKKDEAWRNNLDVAEVITNLGILRVLGQKIRSYSGTEKYLHDALTALMSAGNLPQTDAALKSLFVADPEQKLVWSVIQDVFNVFDTAEGDFTSAQQAKLNLMSADDATAQKREWIADAGRMKQLGLYALADAGALNMTSSVMSGLSTALATFPDYLTTHSEEVEKALRSKKISYAARGLFEESDPQNQERIARILRTALSDPKIVTSALGILQAIDEDSTASSAWDLFQDRNDALAVTPDYQPYRQYFDHFKDDLLSYFSDQTSDPSQGAVQASAGAASADHLRSFVADRLEQGDIDQLLLLANSDPNKTYQVLSEASLYIQNGKLKDFLNLVRRSLSGPPR
jgi:hypothetical protein